VSFGREEAREAPPEFVVSLLPEEDARADLGSRKLAPEFCRFFAMSAKLTDFAEVDVGVPDSWLWTRMGMKLLDSANRELVR
jgi:hypothetical protein